MTTAKQLMNELNKELGPGTIRLGSDPSLKTRYIPTGILPIDVLLQGGLPRNRFTEVFGAYSTLKSYVGLRAIASIQKSGGIAALIDTEHSYDSDWAARLGVKVEDLLYKTPDTGEEAVDITEYLIRQGVDLVVWDSIAATQPQTHFTKRLSKETIQPARLAALMSEASRKLTTANSNTALLFINQTRINVGQMFGDPEVTPGGRAMGFYASYRIAFRKAGKVTTPAVVYDSDGKKVTTKETTAHKIKVTVEKSKLNKPHREIVLTFDLVTGEIDEQGFLISYGLESGLIKHEGQSWQIEGQQKKYRGLEAFKAAVTPKDWDLIRSRCLGENVPRKNRVVRVKKKL